MAPVVNGLKPEYEDSVAFRLYDVSTSAEGNQIANGYGVQYVPTFIFLDAEGNLAEALIGEVTEAQLREVLDRIK
jgi:thioredoxin-related protein